MLEFSISEKLYTILVYASRLMRRNANTNTELPPGQLRVLALSRDMENPTQQKLLNLLQIRPASLSEMLSKLEKSGYIQRTRDEKDKRNVIITPTEKGIAVANENYGKQRERAIKAFEQLDDAEKEQFFATLKKLVNIWEEEESK